MVKGRRRADCRVEVMGNLGSFYETPPFRSTKRTTLSLVQTELTPSLIVKTAYHDSPSIINQKLGYNVPVFQMAQAIPLPRYNYTTGAGGPAPENVRLSILPHPFSRLGLTRIILNSDSKSNDLRQTLTFS